MAMANLPISIAKGVSGFFRWWGSEMAAFLPAALRGRLARGGQRLIVEISDERARFGFEKGRDTRPLGEVTISPAGLAGRPDSGQRDAVAKIVRGARARFAEVVLNLPRDKVLRRLVDLPAVAAENLREVLGFEMDRHTPFKDDEVYFDYRIEGSDPEGKRIKVDLVVVPRAVADQVVQLATSWGLGPDRLAVGGGPEEAARPFNLLPAGAVRARTGLGRYFVLALLVVALLLSAAALYLPLERERKLLAATEAELAKVKSEAIAVDNLKSQIEEILQRGSFVVERKRGEHGPIELLDELTHLVPDHTWVLKFGYRGQRLTLSGYSAKPSSLIGLLEESAMLTGVRFSAPVTMDQKIGLERFNLEATVMPRSADNDS
ncbi:MAG: PilN domain-containing protein [Alphaproteobacteria bacterium]